MRMKAGFPRTWAMTALGSVALLACASAAAPAGAAAATPTAASGHRVEVTLWRATDVKCPSRPSTTARRGAILASEHKGWGCVRLDRHVMTVSRPKAAHAEPQRGGGGWEVDVMLNDRQRREFGRITAAAVGHLLAMLENGRLVTAPTVMDRIDVGEFQLVGLTKSHAQRLARELTNSE